MLTDSFLRFLGSLVHRYGGTKKELARAIGIRPSALSAILKTGFMSAEVALRLARATQTSPSHILRGAGKGELADLIEDQYGDAAVRRGAPAPAIKASEQRVLDRLRELDKTSRRALLLILYSIRLDVEDAEDVTPRVRRPRARQKQLPPPPANSTAELPPAPPAV